GGQAVDDPRSPSCVLLPFEDRAADIPVQQNHRGIRRQYRAQTFLLDASLDGAEEFGVVAGKVRGCWTNRKRGRMVDPPSDEPVRCPCRGTCAGRIRLIKTPEIWASTTQSASRTSLRLSYLLIARG